jgi:hypothetical protein
MGRTLIHAGFHKTGTKSLQGFLSRNRAWLGQKGVHYPEDVGGDFSGHHRLACWLSSARPSGGPNELYLPEREIFSAAISARAIPAAAFRNSLSSRCPVRLLSSEVIATFDAAELARLREFVGEPIGFVLYLRDGIRYLQSCWAAKVRWGYSGAFDEFLRGALAACRGSCISGPIGFVMLLTEMFGPDSVSVRSFDLALMHRQGLVGDFVEHELGVGPLDGLETDGRANTSPAVGVTELQRALNIHFSRQARSAAQHSHDRLRDMLAGPGGEGALASITEAIAPVRRTIRIGDVNPIGVAADGSLHIPGGAPAEGFSKWRFPRDEPASWVRTDDLMDVLASNPEFGRLTAVDS